MKVILICFFLMISNSFAGADCNCSFDENSVSQNLVTLAEVAGKVIGVGDLSRVREISTNEFPFVGRFRSKGEAPESCSGTLVNKNTILTAGHCVELLGKSPLFIITRDPLETKGAASTKLIAKGDDWAYYQLEGPINYDGPYPQFKSLSISELKVKSLMSVGYPVEDSGDLTNKFVVDEKCNVFGKALFTGKLLSNCFSRKGISGGPLLYKENDKYFIVGIRSGIRWGGLRKIFNQAGTAETPTQFFENKIKATP